MPIPLRLLIVEDSPVDVQLLQHILRRGGYEIDCEVVDSAPAMRAALERQEWDAITSDHTMPEFSAPQALALAQQLRPATPVIIVSGEVDLNLAVSLIKDGAQDYVQKQELHRVVPAIERALSEAEARRERERARQALEASEARYRHMFEEARDGLRQVPNYDGLTGLPNRVLFHDRLGQAIRVAEREHHELSLLCLDLNHLRCANDAMGADASDTFVKGAADRIQRQVRQSDTVARIGNEQFAVILPRIAGAQNAATVARKIIEALLGSLGAASQDDAESRVGASIGIAIFPTGAPDKDALLKAADSALDDAKQRGQRYSFGAA
jgi:diguanylate cyclase (GGDEF)-like protein